MTESQATYYDGKTARDHSVSVRLSNGNVTFAGSTTLPQIWRGASIKAVERYTGHGPLRLVNTERVGERLIIDKGDFAALLLRELPGLTSNNSGQMIGKALGWIAGSAAVLAIIGYVILVFAPSHLASMLPERLTAQMGEDMEQTLVSGAKVCSNPAGDRALSAMVASLSQGDTALPPLTIHVYDMSLVNAFTLSGGRIVLTRGLIEKANSADEVAGVLAHEMGHASLLHPEAQLVRLLGVDLVLRVFSGGSSGNTAANLAGLAAVLRSSRDAERDADAYARRTMLSAHVDPAGLKTFFEALLKEEPKTSNSALDAISNVMATHPGLEDRIHDFVPLPPGSAVHPVLSEDDWQALRGICKSS